MPDVPDDYWLRRVGVFTEEDDDGWVEHDGGSRPVDPDTKVAVRFRNTTRCSGLRAEYWDWHHAIDTDARGRDIVAYRVLDSEQPASPKHHTYNPIDGYREVLDMKYREWISWDGGECPVPPDTWVEVYPRQGLDMVGPASRYNWRSRDIFRYRLCAPDEHKEADARWIPHDGGSCPVDPDTFVQVWSEGVMLAPDRASKFKWSSLQKYRVLSTDEFVSRAFGYPLEDEEDEDASPNDHYRQGDIECIDAIRAALTDEEWRGFCKGNVLKYVWREKHKGGNETLVKAQDYLRWAVAGKAEGKR
jgi:hypothetical protein